MVQRSSGGLALLLGSALFSALYAARVLYTGRPTYGFLVWNLALAWAPWALATLASFSASRGRVAVAWALLPVWLAFLPNAPYVVTDFVHLRPRPGAPLWYDVALLGTAAITGLIAGGLSLRAMHAWIAERYGVGAGLALLAASVPAAGFGIYLGRFERHNSWDLVLRPAEVLADVAHLVAEPRAIVVTAVFAALLAVSYVAVGGRVIAAATRRTTRSMPPPTR